MRQENDRAIGAILTTTADMQSVRQECHAGTLERCGGRKWGGRDSMLHHVENSTLVVVVLNRESTYHACINAMQCVDERGVMALLVRLIEAVFALLRSELVDRQSAGAGLYCATFLRLCLRLCCRGGGAARCCA